ncbi:MAG TPA: VWA domain-containing protein [Candidatus Dormibacteraeota bacterium]|jgi:hypothetical protein|nr:VWA domain-containing protein [Candidatus Dormibacteraeota bacterium]
MSFAAPLAGLAGLLLGGVLLLHVLRPQRPDRVVPATLLWREAMQEVGGSVPWRRLRRSWSLLLQLVAGAATVLALTQPGFAAGQRIGGRVAVVLDISATMQATDVSPTRFESARSAVRSYLDGLAPQARVTLVAMGARPHVVADAAGDASTVRRALDGLRPENGAADLEGALSLAAAALGSSTAGGARIAVFSDGVASPPHASLQLPAPVEWHSAGSSGEDVAITGLDVAQGTPGPAVAARVANQGHAHRDLAVECVLDGHVVDRRPLALDGGQARDVRFSLPTAGQVVEVRLDVSDVLALDDVAWAVARPPVVYRVALVTRGDAFLLDALRLRGDVAVTVVDPAAYRASDAWDLTVLDATLPAALPAGPVLIWGPPADGRLGVGGQAAAGSLRPAAADPLLDGVDLATVRVARTRTLAAPQPWRPVVDAASGPVLLVRDAAPRAALVGFDLHESDLPLRPAFPVLVDHLSRFLLPPAAPARPHLPGATVQVTAAIAGAAVSVTRPDGSRLRLPDGGGVLSGADTEQVGVYTATLGSGAGAVQALFTVDALDPGAGSVAPRPAPPLAAPRSTPGTAAPAVAAGRVELWPWLVGLAMLALLGEWLVWERGR